MSTLKRLVAVSLASLLSVSAAFSQVEKKTLLAANIGELSWSKNVKIKAASFSGADEKSAVSIEAAQTKADYHKFKIYSTHGSWKELGAQGVSGGTFANGEITVEKPASTITLRLTKEQAEDLKKGGMVIHGFGVSVKKIELLSAPGKKVAKPSASGKSPAKKKSSSPSPLLNFMGSPYENHGKLHVSGTFLCDSNDRPFQLYGMSTHGLSWFPEYVSKESFTSLRDDWNTNCVRLALYPGEYNGYCSGGNKKELEKIVYRGIEEATALGMYVIVDWHILNENPDKYKEDAKKFLGAVSKKYSSYGNILYEICNEPVNSDWKSQIKPYAEEIIPVIRRNSPDAVIIVGTNTWSQDVDKAAAAPITKYKNIMYAFHFYANTHTDAFRSKLESAIKAKLPVFITEFGTCDASGNGGYNEQQTKLWFDLIKKYNLCHINWSLCNKAETASVISSSCQKKSAWTESDLTQSGRLMRSHFRSLKRQ